jgi:hypothetical protein
MMYPIDKYKYVTYSVINEDCSKSTVVTAISTYGGKTVRGTAKCMETDEFSLEEGKKLAAARCDAKVCSKRVKRAFRILKEASEKLEALEDYHKNALKYYADALEDYIDSNDRLEALTKKMQ